MKLLYFAQLADILQRSHEDVELPAGVGNVDQLLNWLARRGEPWASHMVADRIQVTVNKQFAQPATEVGNDDEVGFFPVRGA
jgi:molybdopterin synthase sulfur carrier subunit